jgi:SOS regulatory protein LexA
MSSDIGERIRETRLARGISMRQLAREIGIDHSHLSKIENGKEPIGRNTLCRVAEKLGADIDLMLGEAGHQAMPFRVLGDVAAGVPIEAIENVETFDLAREFDPHAHFLLRVKGDSMIQDGINSGDLAIVRHADTAETGETVVAVVDGEATLKRLKKNKQTVVLIPANDSMENMRYPADEVEIRGVLVGVVRTSV